VRRQAKASSASSTDAPRLRPRLPKPVLLGLFAALLATAAFAVAPAAATPPAVTMGTATNPTYTTVEVTGSVNPEGESGEWSFQVSSDGGVNWERKNLAGSFGEPVQGTITELKAGTTYKVRLAAYNYSEYVEVHSAESKEFTTETLPAQTATIEPVAGQTATTAHFVGHINPNAPAGNPPASVVHYHFHCEPIGCPGAEDEKEVASGSGPVEVHADAVGLEPNSAYEVSLVTRNNGGAEVDAGPVGFTTLKSAPIAQTIPAFILEGAHDALLGARINPRNSDTHYWFEYGTTTGYGSKAPAEPGGADAGSGGQAKGFSVPVAGLAVGTTYHYRVVAESSGGTSEGEDVTFTTPTPAPEGACPNAAFRTDMSAALPECRAFELASAPDLEGSSVIAIKTQYSTTLPKAFSPVAADGEGVLWTTYGVLPGVNSVGIYDAYRSRRTSTGWKQEFVSPSGPPGSQVRAQHETSLVYADPNLDRLLWAVENPSLDPTDPSPSDCPFGYYRLYRGEPDASFVRITQGPAQQPICNQSSLPTPSTDALHVAFAPGIELVSGAPPGSAYVRSENTTTVVSGPENSGAEPFGISDDGGTVAFSKPTGRDIYVLTDGLTRLVTVAQSPESFSLIPAFFANDGERVIYWSPNPETGDDTDNSRDLYAFDVATESTERLSAPSGSPGASGPGNEDNCQGSWEGNCEPRFVVASPDDASVVYFVSPELLDGVRGVAGAPNLYRRAGGQTTYVTTLDPADEAELFGRSSFFGQGVDGAAGHAAQITAKGGKLIFQSQGRVTAYDSEGKKEIYVYDPATGEIACASCPKDGSPPAGEASFFPDPPSPFVPLFKGRNIPPAVVRYADDRGERVFFTSSDSLSPQDTDTKPDAYVADFARGTVTLLSPGGGGSNYYWGNGGDGRDVFIYSSDRFNQEGDRSLSTYKLWDARVGGGFPPAPPAQARCDGDGCHGSASAPAGGPAPSTSQFEGPPNVQQKHKHHKEKHHKKKHKKKHKAHHKKKHSNQKGAH
jgi:hypothetical protein